MIFKNVVIIRFVSPEMLVVFMFCTMSCSPRMEGAHKCSFIDSKCLGDKIIWHQPPTFGKKRKVFLVHCSKRHHLVIALSE